MGGQLSGIPTILGVLAVVYFPIQLYVLLKVKSLRRLLAAVPLLVMGPLIFMNCMPSAHEDGSLGVLPLMLATPISVIYLAIVSWSASDTVNAKCPNCGYVFTSKSFQLSTVSGPCPQCGKSGDVCPTRTLFF